MKLQFYRTRVHDYTDTKTEHRWRLVGDNGEIVAASSEGFDSRRNARENYQLLRDWFLKGER
jgi:uncharacterized protein YegP (UPF0339 family)